MSLSPSSSSSSSRSQEPRHARHRSAEEQDDVYHRHRKSRQHRERSRRHTSSSLTDRSVESSRGSSRRSSKDSDDVSLASTCEGRPSLQLPTDQEFLPMDKDEDGDEEQERVRDQVICMIFDLPESTQFYQDFSCAIASTLAMHGRMYPTSSHVCFYSNVFGRERKILIPYESIREIEKTTTMVFQHAIRLATSDKDEYTFTSFWGNNRDTCYDLIVKTRNRVLKELRPTEATSSKARYPELPTSPTTKSPVASPPPTLPDEDDEADTEVEADEANDGNNKTAPASPLRRRVVSDVDSIAPKDISMTQILEENFPVSVATFMETFILDNAPFGLDKFGEQTGSTEMTVNPWTSPSEEDASVGMRRSLQFRVPIEAPIGPKSSQVDVLQCLKKSDSGVQVVESSTRLVDIPYGDYFSVEDRWTIVPHASNTDACKLFIELKVVFGKSTFWKKTIETRAISDNGAKWEKWVRMAKDFLKSQDSHNATNSSESSPTSSSSSEKTSAQGAGKKERRSLSRQRSKSNHRHRNSTASARMVSPVSNHRPAPVKVFPWVLVLLLLLVILRLQMTLSTIEQTLQLNTEIVGELQRQLVGLQAQGACAVAT
ncbi:hypothetical protein PHYBOEH_008839 [Phytophthora boehmeriae]|uniref:VASt domain-containing protein n=1 Tax=Phytophthora boehmeriae TaxID=109152 RepID=A0A8T1WZX3_9STRA|nr:hypothetical protein PHYBOEH_008839 [Phytophthora boehmeriae]